MMGRLIGRPSMRMVIYAVAVLGMSWLPSLLAGLTEASGPPREFGLLSIGGSAVAAVLLIASFGFYISRVVSGR